MNVGYLYQDSGAIKTVARKIESVNDSPVRGIDIASLDIIINNPPVQAVHDPITIESGVSEPEPEPEPDSVPEPGDAVLSGVTLIGDSVCLGARKSLSENISDCYLDIAGNRQMWQGYEILMQLQSEDSLREYVVVALGTNGNANTLNMIVQIIENLPSGHRLIFVTPYDGRMTETWSSYKTMMYERTLPEIYSFITVADWAALIETQADLLGTDGIHIGGVTQAIELYTNCIIDALFEASQKPAKD